MGGSVSGHRDLLVWQRGIALVERLYLLTQTYPRAEQFGLTSQTRRAVVSIPANIAEGYGRGTKAAYVGFLRIARGFLLELETHLVLAQRVGIAPATEIGCLLTEVEEIGRMLHALISRVRASDR